jgi:hypothetical protein
LRQGSSSNPSVVPKDLYRNFESLVRTRVRLLPLKKATQSTAPCTDFTLGLEADQRANQQARVCARRKIAAQRELRRKPLPGQAGDLYRAGVGDCRPVPLATGRAVVAYGRCRCYSLGGHVYSLPSNVPL